MSNLQLITLVAILAGPVLAVLVQLLAERRKIVREHQAATFRLLVSTRHLPSDPTYSTAINMTPVDFNGVGSVMAAHQGYIETITYQATPENVVAHEKQMISKQTKLIFEMAKHLGYDLSETDIQTTAYAAGGFVQRDNLMLRAWEAWPRIAEALESQVELSAPEEKKKLRKGAS
ncbi:DUF6680 family protein [Allopontixanthobacter sediminis]|uniref:DUF6680 domain-containing protein n=1 Tax=Allopontixanthobacter sediminis TaxID=1689985 RepID=A0A845B7V8_9SPHN|nr:DUF6680 family protein [Allopontixanthobacter sediminis]MXP43709.1 hypothetical protein [Allopontixanthobacter sediminis]